MRKRTIQLSVVLGLLALFGLWLFRNLRASSAPPPSPASWSPTKPQPKLPTAKLWVGSQELVAEIAREPLQVATGMMFRTNMAPNEAMLFLLGVPQQASFYMRNTLVPLSCAYIDSEGIILEIHHMKPKDETPILSASSNIVFVLEVNQGWFEKNHVGPETLVLTEKGALRASLRKED
jgi:uncharacterized membrane protein (UPF0127 family)